MSTKTSEASQIIADNHDVMLAKIRKEIFKHHEVLYGHSPEDLFHHAVMKTLEFIEKNEQKVVDIEQFVFKSIMKHAEWCIHDLYKHQRVIEKNSSAIKSLLEQSVRDQYHATSVEKVEDRDWRASLPGDMQVVHKMISEKCSKKSVIMSRLGIKDYKSFDMILEDMQERCADG